MWNKERNRPDNWDELLAETIKHKEYRSGIPISNWSFEIGADAMIEPAKAEGRRELIEELGKKYSFHFNGSTSIYINHDEWQQLLREIGE